MADFAGQILLENEEIEVVVDLGSETISLKAGNIEVGTWPAEDCTITPAGDGRWTIYAEDDAVAFQPADPAAFALRVNGTGAKSPALTRAMARPVQPRGRHLRQSMHQGPPPQLITVIGFYALAIVTAVLGLWAVVSMIF